MSFKEDFFEALRSVKRDFFRDSEYTGQTGEENGFPAQHEWSGGEDIPHIAAKDAAAIDTGSLLGDSGDFRMPDNIITADDDPPASMGMSDDEVLDAFQQASAIPETELSEQDDYSASRDDDEEEEETAVYTVNGNNSAAPYRSYNPGVSSAPTVPAANGVHKFYDFDQDDLYSDDKTVISRNTIIRGALQTEDSVRMLGQIMGDIDCKSNIVVAGKIRGNTTAANAYIVDAQIDGNMICDDAININKDAWVLGNIRAQQAEIDGKIKGNIEIRHAVSIGSASSVIGNISTDELEVKKGAFLNGQIIMYSPSRDVIDRFDDFERT